MGHNISHRFNCWTSYFHKYQPPYHFLANGCDSVGFLRPVDHLLFHPEWRCDRCDAALSASEADEAERAANEMWNSKV